MARNTITAALATTLGHGSGWQNLSTIENFTQWRVELGSAAPGGPVSPLTVEVWVSSDNSGPTDYVGSTPPSGTLLTTLVGPNAQIPVKPTDAAGSVGYVNLVVVNGPAVLPATNAFISGGENIGATRSTSGIVVPTVVGTGTGWDTLGGLEASDPWRVELGSAAASTDQVEVWVSSDNTGPTNYGGPGATGTPPSGYKLATLIGPNRSIAIRPLDVYAQVNFVNLVRTQGTAALNAYLTGSLAAPP